MFMLLCILSLVLHVTAMPPCFHVFGEECKNTVCVPVTPSNCNGVIKVNGSDCGCCDLCLLADGGNCSTSPECADGLYCNRVSMTCRPVAGPCATRLLAVDIRYQQSPGMTGLETPHCDINGYYVGVEYAGSTAHCVTKDGSYIDGYTVQRWEMHDMNCICAQDQYAYDRSGHIGKLFLCDPNGNYANVGCTGSVCFCQDKHGKQVGTSTVPIADRLSLNC